MPDPGGYTLLASKGCGSAVAEACLEIAGLPYRLEEVDHEAPGPGRDRLLVLNPLGQVPVLLLPDGAVMTESAAMVLHLAERAPGAGLVPPPGDPSRDRFLRWLAFLVASVYPTFTYGDEPGRFVSGEAAAAELRASTDGFRERCWRIVEADLTLAGEDGPWFLGRDFSVLDLYVAVMTRWRPRRPWFARHCPRLHGVALAVDRDPRVAGPWARNFG